MSTAALEAMLDHALDEERAVLGYPMVAAVGGLDGMTAAAALDQITKALQVDDFGDDRHRTIHGAMLTLHGRGEPPARLALVEELKRTGRLQIAGGPEHLELCEMEHALPALVPRYCEIIRRHAKRRKLAQLVQHLDIALTDRGPDAPTPDVDRLLEVAWHAIAELRATPNASSGPWAAARTVEGLIAEAEPEVRFLYPPILVPGCITEMFSPRGLGKTHLAHAIGAEVARRGFRVLLLDRDNAQGELARRLRGWCCAQDGRFKAMRRHEVPPLRDAAAWAQFPTNSYDFIIIDALDSTAEGIGEQDSGKPSKAIAPVLDLAHGENGPAILVLGNCTKDAKHSRGSGVIEDRADICLEVRDATDLQPTGTKPWLDELPPAGADAWTARAARRKQRDRYRLAVVCTKFRPGREPDPVVLELDLGADPWALRDVTDDLVAAGEQARQEATRERAQRLNTAATALVTDLHRRRDAQGAMPTKTEAEGVLMAAGLKRKEARTLLDERAGQAWACTPKDAKAVLVTPLSPGGSAKSGPLAATHEQRHLNAANHADRMDIGRRDLESRIPAKTAAPVDTEISPASPEHAPAESEDEARL